MEFSIKRNRVIAFIIVLVLTAGFIFSACYDRHSLEPATEELPAETIEYSELNRAVIKTAAVRVVERLMERGEVFVFFEELDEIIGERTLESLKSAGITDAELTAIIAAVRDKRENEEKETDKEEDAEKTDEGESSAEKENEEQEKRGKLAKLSEAFESAGVKEKKLVCAVYYLIRAFDDMPDLAVFAETINKREAVSILAGRDAVDKEMIGALINTSAKENDHTRVIAKAKILYAILNAKNGVNDEDLEKKIQKLVIKHDIETGVDAEDMIKAMRNWAEYVGGYQYGEEVEEITFDSIFAKFVKDIKMAVRNAIEEEEGGNEEKEDAEDREEKNTELIEQWKEYPAVHMPKG